MKIYVRKTVIGSVEALVSLDLAHVFESVLGVEIACCSSIFLHAQIVDTTITTNVSNVNTEIVQSNAPSLLAVTRRYPSAILEGRRLALLPGVDPRVYDTCIPVNR